MTGFAFDPSPDGPRRPRQSPNSWEGVRRSAHRSTREVGPTPVVKHQQLAYTYESWLRDFAPLMTKVSGRTPRVMPNRVSVVDRRGFVDAMVGVMDRLTSRIGGAGSNPAIADRLMRWAMGRMVGEMSKGVLGLYVPEWQAGSGQTALYMVQPNIESMARRMGVPADSFARSILFHEATHHWQFSEHPWLDKYMEQSIQELNSGLDFKRLLQPGVLQDVLKNGLSALTPGMAQLQATMSVIEGYSDFVMETLGRQYIPDFDRIEAGMARMRLDRKGNRSQMEQLVGSLTGMDQKMRQYSEGKAFCQKVEKIADLATLNLMWDGPVMLPTPEELQHPELWVDRVRRGMAPAA